MILLSYSSQEFLPGHSLCQNISGHQGMWTTDSFSGLLAPVHATVDLWGSNSSHANLLSVLLIMSPASWTEWQHFIVVQDVIHCNSIWPTSYSLAIPHSEHDTTSKCIFHSPFKLGCSDSFLSRTFAWVALLALRALCLVLSGPYEASCLGQSKWYLCHEKFIFLCQIHHSPIPMSIACSSAFHLSTVMTFHLQILTCPLEL